MFDISSLINEEAYAIELDGRTYTIEQPAAEIGVFVQDILRVADEKSANRVQEIYEEKHGTMAVSDVQRMLLGDVYDEMIEAGESFPALRLVTNIAAEFVLGGREAADTAVQKLLDAQAEADASKRPAPKDHLPKRRGTTSRSTALARRTKKASTQIIDSQIVTEKN